MSTEIEDFIREHRQEFDTDRPSARLWQNIEQELENKNRKGPVSIHLWIGIASSIIVLLGISLLYIFPAKKNLLSVADVSPVYAKKQIRFCSLIEKKRDSLETFAGANPELYQKFSTDLEKLNLSYEGLKKDLPGSPNQQLVVGAMIKNLEVQLQLLSQQLSIINEVNAYKKENSI